MTEPGDVIDFELRFVNSTAPAPEHGANIARTVRVLQWRRKRVTMRFSGARLAEWDDWEDVPFVEEEPR